MFVTCFHLKPLVIPVAVSIPAYTVNGVRRHLATVAPLHNQFPYPSHPRPTPYQIFHLPLGANQKQVKARCESSAHGLPAVFLYTLVWRLTFLSVVIWEDYELVRVHHPDSPHSRTSDLPKRIRDERFSAITDAYDVLTGKKPGNPSRWNSPDSGRDWEFRSELERRRHRRTPCGPQTHPYSQSHCGHQHYTPQNNGPMTPEDRRRDNVLICVAFVVRMIKFIHSLDVGDQKQFSPSPPS